MPKTRGAWKRYERIQAAVAGWEREPVTGRANPLTDPGDAKSGGFYTEIRDREEARPLRWFRETAAAAHAQGKVPLLLFKGPAPHLSPLAIMRWTDLAEVILLARRAAGAGPTEDREHDAAGHKPGDPEGGSRPLLGRTP